VVGRLAEGRNEVIFAVSAGILSACDGAAAEVIAVDDGSRDGTGNEVAALAASSPRVRLVRHPRAAGQSAAVHSGVLAARGRIVCTLDGDGQNPPEEIPVLLAPLLDENAPPRLALVAGQRAKRNDPLPKRVASRAANAIRGWLLRDGTRDTGCGLKAFRREAYLALPYFNHMHRYLPALFQRDGWDVTHVDVTHRPRSAGRSKYNNLGRAIVGLSDLFGVAWLIRRRRALAPDETSIRSTGISANGRAERPS